MCREFLEEVQLGWPAWCGEWAESEEEDGTQPSGLA